MNLYFQLRNLSKRGHGRALHHMALGYQQFLHLHTTRGVRALPVWGSAGTDMGKGQARI